MGAHTSISRSLNCEECLQWTVATILLLMVSIVIYTTFQSFKSLQVDFCAELE